MPERCVTCGQRVEVQTGEEGTSSYVPAAEARVAELEAAIRDTLCDDEPCSRCDHLRAALKGEQHG